MSSIPELLDPLSDGVVALRPYAQRDIPEILIAYQDDPELHVSLGYDRPPSGAELGRLSERADADRAAGIGISLTILQQGSDTCVGEVEIHKIDWMDGRAELGMWLAPQVRGRGLAARALRLLARWLFENCGIKRLEIITEPSNRAMIRAAQAAGFAHEGVLRGHTRERGGRVDCAIMSLLPSDLAGPSK
jgi:RimJ/RimL family protein N-acetyltransferase